MIKKKLNDNVKDEQNFTIISRNILNFVNLNSTQKLVFIAIKSYCRSDFMAFPSAARIAADVGISSRSVFRCLAALEAAGLLTRQRRRREDGGITSNMYTLSPYDKDVISPCDKDVISPCDKDVTLNNNKFKNNNLFKINKTRARAKAEQSVRQALQNSAKDAAAWVSIVRLNDGYAIRQASKYAFNVISKEDFNNMADFVQQHLGSCRRLEWGQYMPGEVVF